MNTNTEYLFPSESMARAERRKRINGGSDVSLIAYDGERDAYVFDVRN